MKKLIKYLSIPILLAGLALLSLNLFSPELGATGQRTRFANVNGDNTWAGENSFNATTTLENGFVSTSTPTQAGQIVGLDEDGKLPAVDGSGLTGILAATSTVSIGNVRAATTNQAVSTSTQIVADAKFIFIRADLYSGNPDPANYISGYTLTIVPGIKNSDVVSSYVNGFVGMSASLSGTTLTISSAGYAANTFTHFAGLTVSYLK